MKPQRLNLDQFQAALAAANRHFSLIREKYPSLRGYLVIALLGDQTKTDSKLGEMIKEFPALLAAGPAKILMQNFRKTPQPEKPTDVEKKQWEDQFQSKRSTEHLSHFRQRSGGYGIYATRLSMV